MNTTFKDQMYLTFATVYYILQIMMGSQVTYFLHQWMAHSKRLRLLQTSLYLIWR